MLSELSKVVAKSLYDEGCELIFPYIESAEELENNSNLIVANKIFAKISCDKQKIATLIRNAKISWEKSQIDYALTALEKMQSIRKIKINENLYKQQIGDSGEFFASWIELSGDYNKSKDKLEKILAGRKNLREFKKQKWNGYGVRKSSLDGARETVFKGKPQEITGLLKSNEYLDTLGCIKRFYPIATGKAKHFEDLSDIALIPYLHKIYSDNRLENLLSDYESFFTRET
jgi:CRISPR-associated protein Cmr2